MEGNAHPYSSLTPDVVLDALASVGLDGDGRLLALGSYENRVYLAYRDEAPAVVVKFYRPERWSDAQILEEHAFALELAAREIPVVAPLVFDDGDSLHAHAGFRFAIYPRRGGRAPELSDRATLEWIGRFLGRIHAIGAEKPFVQRPQLDVESFGDEPRAYIVASDWLPADLRDVWSGVSAQALDGVRRAFERAGALATIRLHGDCHAGNVLWTDDGPHFVDLDDCRMGLAVQDLWMLMPGERDEAARALEALLEGYERFSAFDRRELLVVEALRTLRLIHYSAWIARRFDDPAFPVAFPWFGSGRYWQDRILELREQIAAMDEPPLAA